MRIFLTKRSVRLKLIIILFILLFLTAITSLFVSNTRAVDAQSESDTLTFSSLGIKTKVFSSENGEECEETIEFNIDIDDNSHNRYSLNLNYMTGASRPSNDFEITVTINGEHVIKNSIFRFIERDIKQWKYIGIPHEYLQDGTNTITIIISLKSLSTSTSTFTLYSESNFRITKINIIKSTGDYLLSNLAVLPSNTYEDKVVGTGSIGGFYTGVFEPQVEFLLQGNMTSIGAQLDLILQKDVPTDCKVNYNIFINNEALYEENMEFNGAEVRIQHSLTTLKAGRNSIQFQIQISSYRVAGENGAEKPYNFVLKIADSNSKISFFSSSVSNSSNNEISITGLPNVILFSLVVGLLLFIPSFLFITLKYKRSLVNETKVQTLSYTDANDSGRVKTLRIREET